MNAGLYRQLAASLIDPGLLAAYHETQYHVHGDRPFTLRIDVPSSELLVLYRRHGVASSAFITACNPRSERMDEAANAFRQAALLAEINRRSLHSLPGLGEHPTNGWDGEPSFLVLDLSLEAAKALGRRFGQNAILWCGDDAIPRLVVSR